MRRSKTYVEIFTNRISYTWRPRTYLVGFTNSEVSNNIKLKLQGSNRNGKQWIVKNGRVLRTTWDTITWRKFHKLGNTFPINLQFHPVPRRKGPPQWNVYAWHTFQVAPISNKAEHPSPQATENGWLWTRRTESWSWGERMIMKKTRNRRQGLNKHHTYRTWWPCKEHPPREQGDFDGWHRQNEVTQSPRRWQIHELN